MDEQIEFLKIIGTRLSKAKIPYMLTGSLAMSIYAEPRMTRDIDIVVEFQRKDVDRLIELFKDIGFVDRKMVEEAVLQKRMFNILHKKWFIKADFIMRKSGVYRELEFSRRREKNLEGVGIWVVSPEDLILSKLDWAKESVSELQMRDVKAIIAAVADLNWDYLQKWSNELGVKTLLDQGSQP